MLTAFIVPHFLWTILLPRLEELQVQAEAVVLTRPHFVMRSKAGNSG